MDKVIYSKFSNDRSPEFNIRTEICADNKGKRCIRKYPSTDASIAHVNSMLEHYVGLNDQFAGSAFKANHCKKKAGYVEFEYINGKTLEVTLNQMIADNDMSSAYKLLHAYVDEIHKIYGKEEFKLTEEFKQIFGEVSFSKTMYAGSVYDIDLIFANIIISDGIWHVIDYEWTFDFPIPADFVIYRAMFYYFLENPKSRESFGDLVYKELGFTAEDVEIFHQMDNAFQKYTKGTSHTLNDWVAINSSRSIINISDVAQSNRLSLQVYYDFGNGFSEENSNRYEYKLNNDKNVELSLEVPAGVKRIRIDPAEQFCLITIIRFQLYTSDNQIEVEFQTNGKIFTSNSIFFDTKDPQLYIININEDVVRCEIFYHIDYLLKDNVTGIDAYIDENLAERQKLSEVNSQLAENLRISKNETERLNADISLLSGQKEVLENEKEVLESEKEVLKSEKEILKSEKEVLIRDNLAIEKEWNRTKVIMDESLEDKDQKIAQLEEEIRKKQQEIDEIHASNSWRITKPLRMIGGQVKK